MITNRHALLFPSLVDKVTFFIPCMVYHAGTVFSQGQSAGAASAVVAALVMRRSDDEVEATRADVFCAKLC